MGFRMLLFSLRHPLSQPDGCQLSQRESQGVIPYLPAKLQFVDTRFKANRKQQSLTTEKIRYPGGNLMLSAEDAGFDKIKEATSF